MGLDVIPILRHISVILCKTFYPLTSMPSLKLTHVGYE